MKRRLYLDPRKWSVLLVVLLLLAYVLGGVTLKFWLDRQPHNQVTLADLMLPWRWTEVPGKRGEGYALRGVDELGTGNVQTGIFLLQRGLSGQPDNDGARLALARFYAENNYYDGVLRTVRPQLEFGASRDLLSVFFEAALAADDLEEVQNVSAAQVVAAGANQEQRWWLQRWQARALEQMGRDRELLNLLRQPEMLNDRGMAALRMKALLAVGEPEEAWALATTIGTNALDTIPLNLELQAEWQVKQADHTGLVATLRQVLMERSGVPLAWLLAVRKLAEAGEVELAEQHARDYLVRWGARLAAVRQLLGVVMDSDNAEVALGVFQAAQQYVQLTVEDRFALCLVQVANGRWDDLAESLKWIERAMVGQDLSLSVWIRWLQAVNDTAREPERRDDLASTLSGTRMRLVMYRVMLEGFDALGDLATVALVAESGQRVHPQSWQMRTWAERVRQAIEDRDIEITNTKVARASVAEVALQNGREGVPADMSILAETLRASLEAGRWVEVGQLVRQVRRTRPDWLEEAGPLLGRAEVLAAAGQKDWLRVKQLAPALLRQDPEHWSNWLMDQAELIVEDGNADFARKLVDIVLEQDVRNPRARSWIRAARENSAAEIVPSRLP